jgi:hypothetical protein
MSSTAKVTRTKKEVESKESKVEVKPEPVVEVKPDEVPDAEDAEDSKKVTFDELMEEMQDEYKQICASVVSFKAKMVALRRSHNQAMRQQSNKKKTRKVVVDSGILKPVPLPVEAETFLKDIGVAIPESNLMRRTELSAAIYEYVKSHTLYKADPSKESGYDRKVIIPDAKLKKLFSLSADQTLDFSSINVNLATIYRRAKELLAGGAAPVVVPAPTKAAAPVAAPAKKGGKVAGSSA